MSHLVGVLERLPGFRNVLVHEYLALDMNQVIVVLNHLEPVEEFLRIVGELEKSIWLFIILCGIAAMTVVGR